MLPVRVATWLSETCTLHFSDSVWAMFLMTVAFCIKAWDPV